MGKKEKERAEETGGAGEGRNVYFSVRAGTVEFVCPLQRGRRCSVFRESLQEPEQAALCRLPLVQAQMLTKVGLRLA